MSGKEDVYAIRRLILVLMLKVLAYNSQQIRTMKAGVMDTVLMPRKCEVHTALEEEGKASAHAVVERRKNKETPNPPGPSTAHVLLRFLEVLATRDVGAKNKQEPERLAIQMGPEYDFAPTFLLREVTVCKSESCHDQAWERLVVAMRGFEDRDTVFAALVQLGHDYKLMARPSHIRVTMSPTARPTLHI